MIAKIALMAWPLVSLILFMVMTPQRALIWTLLGGYLLLPANFILIDLPGVPEFDKTLIPSMAALLLAPLMARTGEFRWPKGTVLNLLMLVWIFVPFITMLHNPEPLIAGTNYRPGLSWWDALSACLRHFLELVPFILGAGLLANEKGHSELIKIFVLAAVFYSVPILAEIRLSPFIQRSVYGIQDAEYFLQQLRAGGFRAMVFLGHGLLIGVFMAIATVGAFHLWRTKTPTLAIPPLLVALFLFVVLVLNKALGSVLLVLVLIPMMLYLSQRRFLTSAFVIAVMLTLYPMVRAADVLPLKSFISAVEGVAPERAESFAFRVQNEDLLLHRAFEKPFFGWGGRGRGRVIVANNWGTSSDLAVTDGTWIVILGQYGWVGYCAYFGILTYPLWRGLKMRRAAVPPATIALSTMLLVGLIDLIPNASLGPMTWLIAGAIANLSLARRRVALPANAPRPFDKGMKAQAAVPA